ncbi:MAG: hypothetical protein HOI47_29680 [Candidatus Scalindua sp.]|jgi:hypothetical protein|nr:hypothetical protein [Candidatus Scalindua sp.]
MDEFDKITRDLESMNDIYESVDKDEMSACYFMALRSLANKDGIVGVHNEIMSELLKTQESAGVKH